jgi:tetratricopeptide (TPR) repeat protein
LGQHRFGEARRLAQQCVQREPADAMAYGLLADACVELGEYKAAVAAVQKMVDLQPGTPAYARVAYLRELHGEREGALQMMRLSARAASPAAPESRAWCWTQVGDLLFDGGKLKEARRQYDLALFYRPRYPLALAGKARVATAEWKLAEAEQLLIQAISVSSQPELHSALGDVYFLAGKREQARKQYALVLKAEQAGPAAGAAPECHHRVLFCANHNRGLETALSLARREYAGRNDIFTCDALGWALYKNGRYGEAWRVAQQALRLNTQDAQILYHAGMIARRVPGQKEKARRLLQRALALNPYFDLREVPKARAALAAL